MLGTSSHGAMILNKGGGTEERKESPLNWLALLGCFLSWGQGGFSRKGVLFRKGRLAEFSFSIHIAW